MLDNKFFNLFRKKENIDEEETNQNQTFMIVGLGNPGKEYQKNRHNIGFMAIEEIAKSLGFENRKVKSKAIIMEGKQNNRKIILVKPQTYMNLSGSSVAPLIRFYKVIPENLIVIHDDLDLPVLSIRLRPNGGAGGQKGVASIIQNLGTQDFNRVRVGIGRPPGRMEAANYVLKNFSKQEESELPFLLNTIKEAVMAIMDSGIEIAMNQFNGDNKAER
jgi:PTH1 family peptidyl-tRNA hydrolase